MSLADNCETLARDLGVWREPGTDRELRRDEEALVEGAFAVWSWYEGPASVLQWELVMRVDGELRRHRLDQWTLALLLIGRARGERVDFGRCPECDGDGVQHWGCTNPDREPSEFKIEGWVPRGGPQWSKHQPCPCCPPRERNSKAAKKRAVHAGTGRDVRPWERALLDAMPKPRGGPKFNHALGRHVPDTGPWAELVPGDSASRDALAAHVHLCSGPEHAVVLGDWLLAFPGRPLSELPPPTAGLGVLLDAWLRGVIVAHTDRLKAETRAAIR